MVFLKKLLVDSFNIVYEVSEESSFFFNIYIYIYTVYYMHLQYCLYSLT